MRASTRDPLQTLKDATSSITSLSIPPDSVQIIAGSMDGHVRAYDIRMGQMTEDLVGCKSYSSFVEVAVADRAAPVTAVVPSPSSPKDTLLVASQDGKLRLFDRSNGSVSLPVWSRADIRSCRHSLVTPLGKEGADQRSIVASRRFWQAVKTASSGRGTCLMRSRWLASRNHHTGKRSRASSVIRMGRRWLLRRLVSAGGLVVS